MQAARTFMAAHFQIRQLSFGSVDLELHVAFDPASDEDPLERARGVLGRFQHGPELADEDFIASFAHIRPRLRGERALARRRNLGVAA